MMEPVTLDERVNFDAAKYLMSKSKTTWLKEGKRCFKDRQRSQV